LSNSPDPQDAVNEMNRIVSRSCASTTDEVRCAHLILRHCSQAQEMMKNAEGDLSEKASIRERLSRGLW